MRGTKFLQVLSVLIVVCTLALPAHAEWVTIGLTAQVTSVSDSYNLLGGTIAIGSAIHGTYAYDTSTSAFPAGSGAYWHYQSPAGMVLSVGGYTFQTNPVNVKFLVGISDNYNGSIEDHYNLRSYNNLPLSSGVIVDHISWQLDDSSGMALNSLLLPSTQPNLSLWQGNNLYISGGQGGTAPCFDSSFIITGQVTFVELVPEPATLLLFGLSGLMLRNRKA